MGIGILKFLLIKRLKYPLNIDFVFRQTDKLLTLFINSSFIRNITGFVSK